MNFSVEKIQAILNSAPEVEFGIAVQHIESGEELLINAEALFPTASVFKIPVMVEVFKQAAEGKFNLTDRLTLRSADKTLTTGILLHMEDGLQLTLRDLMMLMTIVSDNTATTMLMNLVGAQNITNTMHAMGLQNIHVTITVHEMFLHAFGIPEQKTVSPAELTEIARNKVMDYRSLTFARTPENDVSSARDMTRLLAMIYKGEVVSRAACDEMLTFLSHQQYNSRLPRFLPWYSTYHKTGSMRGVRNDSGIIYCGPKDHLAVSVFSFDPAPLQLNDPRQSVLREELVDNMMGEIGLTLYQSYSS